MKLVSSKDVAKALSIDKFGFFGHLLSIILLRLTGISNINKFYAKYCKETGITFLNSILNYYKIKYSIPEKDLTRIPITGSFIIVCNHPLGTIDGVILLKTLLEKRTDFKLMSNFLLQKLTPLRPYLIGVNPFDKSQSTKSSISGMKECILHLKSGRPLAIFPAGEVSTKKEGKIYIDKQWEPSVIKLIKKSEVPVSLYILKQKIAPYFTGLLFLAIYFELPDYLRRLILKNTVK